MLNRSLGFCLAKFLQLILQPPAAMLAAVFDWRAWQAGTDLAKGVLVDLALEMPISANVCETCVERGRPNVPVYKMKMCEFCHKGVSHPNATKEQLEKERVGGRYESRAAFLPKR